LKLGKGRFWKTLDPAGAVTTEQIIILGFLALAFLAGWVARAVVGMRERGGERDRARDAETGEAGPAGVGGQADVVEPAEVGGSANVAVPAPTVPARPAIAPAAHAVAQPFEGTGRSRDELERAVRAYHAAVVRTFSNGSDGDSGATTLEALSAALVALSRAVDHEARKLEARHPLTERLQRTGFELHRLADDVMRHSADQELPAGVFDRLEQNLISAASMILAPSRAQPHAA
jgi:hypothetical protein